VRDIGGRPQVILIVVYRCAIEVTCDRNQEEKDAFDKCILSVRIRVRARPQHGTVLVNRSDSMLLGLHSSQ
jgi:hypothetical protein